ncbi:hypothetical protein [Streptomyces sp. NPDC050534]|uniref:hypothetical protein n=1 Tax=Streptomyces sp. NPDC050534 TaxID=3365625 RepID=UPI003794F17B
MSSPDLELTIDVAVAVTFDQHVRVPVRFSYADTDLYAVQVSAAGLGDVKFSPIEEHSGR